MARPKNPALAVRNDQVYSLWRSGKSLAWLAEKYERTPQQIGRIVASYHPELEEDDDRALHRGRLESLYEEVQAVVDAPGVKLAPNGRPACDEDGSPLEDVGAKIEALKLQLLVLESTRKLDARDRPQKRNLTIEIPEAQRQAKEALAAERARMELRAAERKELEALRRQAGQVIPGQVERTALEG